MWWLLLCVSWTGQRDSHIAGKVLFLGSFLEVFPVDLAFESVDCVKITLTSGVGIVSSVEGPMEQEGRERAYSLSLSLCYCFFLLT